MTTKETIDGLVKMLGCYRKEHCSVRCNECDCNNSKEINMPVLESAIQKLSNTLEFEQATKMGVE